MRKCRDCGNQFNEKDKFNKPGYIDQCGHCAQDVERYVGRNKGGKSVQIEIFRKDTEYWRRQFRRENAIGFNANLPVNHPVAVQKIESKRAQLHQDDDIHHRQSIKRWEKEQEEAKEKE